MLVRWRRAYPVGTCPSAHTDPQPKRQLRRRSIRERDDDDDRPGRETTTTIDQGERRRRRSTRESERVSEAPSPRAFSLLDRFSARENKSTLCSSVSQTLFPALFCPARPSAAIIRPTPPPSARVSALSTNRESGHASRGLIDRLGTSHFSPKSRDYL